MMGRQTQVRATPGTDTGLDSGALRAFDSVGGPLRHGYGKRAGKPRRLSILPCKANEAALRGTPVWLWQQGSDDDGDGGAGCNGQDG